MTPDVKVVVLAPKFGCTYCGDMKAEIRVTFVDNIERYECYDCFLKRMGGYDHANAEDRQSPMV